MKWYSHRLHKQHLRDLRLFRDDDEMREIYRSWVNTVANSFDRSYPRIGILNFSDLIQEGYIGYFKAWDKLDWKLINSVVDEEKPALITNYIKVSIKRHIVRVIARDRDTIRIPENYYRTKSHSAGKEYEYNTDIFLTRTFASFFNVDYMDVIDDRVDYQADVQNEVLNYVMDNFLSKLEKEIIKMFYGIDEPHDKSISMKRIAEYHHKNEGNIRKIKQRSLDKLKQEHIKEIIENNLKY